MSNPQFFARAAVIHSMTVSRVFKPATGTLGEYFDETSAPKSGVAGSICEPGHHYEWSWLLRRYSGIIGKETNQVAEARLVHANRFGFDSSGFVVDELLDNGTVHRASRRSWPQTQAIQACVAAFEAGHAESTA
jgi:mannose/cellobiose epimerase-like protein (N-acyl-D-glucosamine 2-epimerase family)